MEIDFDKIQSKYQLPDDELEALRETVNNFSSQRWRMNNLYKIVDAHAQEIQFKMNYAQKLLYLDLWYRSVILKSRQHGITTFFCLLFLDICLFNSNTHAAIIAHNKDDAKDFFKKKILFAYNNLPKFVKEEIGAVQESTTSLSFKNGSSIRVTTSGRSGTYQLIHITELGKMCAKFPWKAEEVISGTLNTIHEGQIITVESTAEGREGHFYEMCKKAMAAKDEDRPLGRMEWKFFFFGWPENELNKTDPKHVPIPKRLAEYFEKIEAKNGYRLTPEQKAWYVSQEATQGDLMFREHPSDPKEAFDAALKGSYFERELTKARKDKRITKVEWRDDNLVDTYWDIGYNDETTIWFVQTIGTRLHIIDYYENSGEGLGHYANYLSTLPYKYHKWYAPWDIMKHDWVTGRTALDQARAMGVNFEIGPRISKKAQIENARRLMATCWFDREKCERGLACLDAYRKEWNEKLGTYKDNPLHDWASHGADSFELLACMHPFTEIAIPSDNANNPEDRDIEESKATAWFAGNM